MKHWKTRGCPVSSPTPAKGSKQRGLGSIYRRTVDGRELPTWHVQFSVNGRQYRESTGTESYNEAQKYLKRRITEVTTGKFVGTQADRITMSELQKNTK
jgi:hypothetical protein